MRKLILIFCFSLSTILCIAQNYEWRPIVPGLDCIDSTFDNCNVSFLVNDTFHNTIWVLGVFEGAGGIQSAYAVGYDGLNWIQFPGIFNASILSFTNCAIMHNGNLILGKDDRVLEFNFSNNQWTTIGITDGEVLCFTIYDGDLIAGGDFNLIDNYACQFGNVAKWNGTQWDTLGHGIDSYDGFPVRCLEVFNGKLYAGGTFQYVYSSGQTTESWNIASWDGTNWNNPYSNGVFHGTSNLNGDYYGGSIFDMEVFANKLYITGQFEKVCGIQSYLAYWDDTTWTGTSYPIWDGEKLVTCNNMLYIKHLGGPWISSFDGTNTVSPIDSTFDSGLNDLTEFQNKLYISGAFNNSAATPTFRLARLMDVGNGINEIENASAIKIYPNPAQSEITIETSTNELLKLISVYDLLGRELIQQKPVNSITQINIAALSAGVYLLRIESMNGSIQIVKFIME